MAPTTILGTIFLGTCAIILCGGMVAGEVSVAEMILGTGCLIFLAKMVDKFTRRRSEEGGLSAAQAERLEARLAELERRLTDIQEVQIALSEKSEYLEKKQAKE